MSKWITLTILRPDFEDKKSTRKYKALVDYDKGYVIVDYGNSTIIERLERVTFKESPAEILELINPPFADVDECFECEAHPDAELRQAARKLITMLLLVDFKDNVDIIVPQIKKLESLLEKP